MARTKHSVARHKRHKEVLKLTAGQRLTRHSLYKRAHEAMMHSLRYAYIHRRQRKRDIRRLWIVRINAAARQAGLPYRELISGLKKAGVAVNRKILAELAATDEPAFAKLVEVAKGATAPAPS